MNDLLQFDIAFWHELNHRLQTPHSLVDMKTKPKNFTRTYIFTEPWSKIEILNTFTDKHIANLEELALLTWI